jgi:hypothetical protein
VAAGALLAIAPNEFSGYGTVTANWRLRTIPTSLYLRETADHLAYCDE